MTNHPEDPEVMRQFKNKRNINWIIMAIVIGAIIYFGKNDMPGILVIAILGGGAWNFMCWRYPSYNK